MAQGWALNPVSQVHLSALSWPGSLESLREISPKAPAEIKAINYPTPPPEWGNMLQGASPGLWVSQNGSRLVPCDPSARSQSKKDREAGLRSPISCRVRGRPARPPLPNQLLSPQQRVTALPRPQHTSMHFNKFMLEVRSQGLGRRRGPLLSAKSHREQNI